MQYFLFPSIVFTYSDRFVSIVLIHLLISVSFIYYVVQLVGVVSFDMLAHFLNLIRILSLSMQHHRYRDASMSVCRTSRSPKRQDYTKRASCWQPHGGLSSVALCAHNINLRRSNPWLRLRDLDIWCYREFRRRFVRCHSCRLDVQSSCRCMFESFIMLIYSLIYSGVHIHLIYSHLSSELVFIMFMHLLICCAHILIHVTCVA